MLGLRNEKDTLDTGKDDERSTGYRVKMEATGKVTEWEDEAKIMLRPNILVECELVTSV